LSASVEFQIAITGSMPDGAGLRERYQAEVIKAIESVLLPMRREGVDLGILVMNVGEPPWQSRS
jgi:hypothetical protein